LIGTMTTTVLEYYDYADGSDIQLGFVMKDANGNEINRGVMDAYYEDDSFYMKMSNNMHMTPDVVKYLSMQNDLVADFLDYPNPMGDEYPMDMYSEPIFAMDAGNYTITNKSDKSDFVRV
ncbi:MAG: hypothetical protein LUD68_06085, partial [Rikenellaceae bacterium]|nr:hypothetical protein [Rikenellaceae bacterium]